MTVRELIEKLQMFDGEKEVLVFCGPLQEELGIVEVLEEEGQVMIY